MLATCQHKMSQIRRDAASITEFIRDALQQTLKAISTNNIKHLQHIKDSDIKYLNYLASSLDNEVVVALALYSPKECELRELISMLKITNELLRISECTQLYAQEVQDILDDSTCDTNPIRDYLVKINGSSLASVVSISEYFKSAINSEAMQILHTNNHNEHEFSLVDIPINQADTDAFIKIAKALKRHEQIVDHCENIGKLINSALENGENKVVN